MIKKGISLLLTSVLLSMPMVACTRAFASENQPTQDAAELISPSFLNTLNTLEKVDDCFYLLDYNADYILDDLLLQGVESDKAMYAFISKRILEGLPFNYGGLDLGCSSFTAANPDGDFIQGRNADLSYAQNILVHTKPENGYESLTMVSGHMIGYSDAMPSSKLGQLYLMAAPYFPGDGINEKGLSVVTLLQYGAPVVRQNTGKTPIITTLATRIALDRAATVEEAIELFSQYDLQSIWNSSFHFQIADASGNSVVIEYVDDEMHVIRPEGYGQVVTNFLLTPGAVDPYRDGEDRLLKLQSALDENKGVVNAEQVWDMLKGVTFHQYIDDRTGIEYNTMYSILYNNTRRTMDVCVNGNFDKVFRYTLGETK